MYFWSSVFFFSSRSRHTRFDCDWSSDVCSSDLLARIYVARGRWGRPAGLVVVVLAVAAVAFQVFVRGQIGRASCRGSVETSRLAVSVRYGNTMMIVHRCPFCLI